MRFGLSTLLYTFGEPRVGDADFASSLALHTLGSYRVVHASDCVPHLPPCCGGLWKGEGGREGGREGGGSRRTHSSKMPISRASKSRTKYRAYPPSFPPCPPPFPLGRCLPKPQCPFHHGQEVWYDDGMAEGAAFVMCPGDEVCREGGMDGERGGKDGREGKVTSHVFLRMQDARNATQLPSTRKKRPSFFPPFSFHVSSLHR